MEDYKPYAPKWNPIPVGGCCESAPQQAQATQAKSSECNLAADLPYVGASLNPTQQGPLYYDLKLTQAEVLHLAQRVPSFRPLLESLAPEAFYEVVNAVDAISENWQQDVRLSLDGAYEGLGLDLPVSYQWEIVPGSFGLGQALVGKRRIG